MTVEEYNKSVDSYSDGIFRFILKNIKDEDEAKDIVNTVTRILKHSKRCSSNFSGIEKNKRIVIND